MKYGKLRIAWSVGWGVVAVLLVVLWVRSYWREDEVNYMPSGNVVWHAVSWRGGVLVCMAKYDPKNPGGWRVYTAWEPGLLGFSGFSTKTSKSARFPIWFLLVVSALFSALPWRACRFSLQTLLIATTVVAITLGLVTYALRG